MYVIYLFDGISTSLAHCTDHKPLQEVVDLVPRLDHPTIHIHPHLHIGLGRVSWYFPVSADGLSRWPEALDIHVNGASRTSL